MMTLTNRIICCVLILSASLGDSLAQVPSARVRNSLFCAALTDEIPNNIWLYEYLKVAQAKINNYLKENEPNTDKDTNVLAASKWLDSLRRTGIDEWTEKALVAFIELPQVLGAAGCVQPGFEILLKNIIPNTCRSHLRDDPPRPRRTRVQQIIHDFAFERAKVCRPKYLEMFEKQYNELDTDTRCIVSQLFSVEIEQKILAGSSYDYRTILNVDLGGTVSRRVPFADIASQVKRISPDQPCSTEGQEKKVSKGGWWVIARSPREKLDPEEVRRFVIEPCRKLRAVLGDVFRSVRLDKFLGREEEGKDSFETYELFMSSWHSFRICELLLSFDEQSLAEKFRA